MDIIKRNSRDRIIISIGDSVSRDLFFVHNRFFLGD